jgi:integral membrane sensor domain MASE1
VLAITAVYMAVARVSILFSFQSTRITPIYPAAGLALVAALLLGRRGLAGVWLGAVATVTISALSHGASSLPAWSGALGMGVTGGTGAMAGAWLGALLVNRFSEGPFFLESGWNVLVLLLAGAFAGGAVSPTVGVLSLSCGGMIPWHSFGISWLTWWVGDAGGIVVFAPLLLAWTRRETRVPDLRVAMETAFLIAATALVSYGVFFRNLHFEYGLLPLVLWAAFRFGARGATSVSAAITALATVGTSLGRSPFARGTVTEALLNLHLFLLVTVFCALLLAGLLAERRPCPARGLHHR